VDEVTSCAEKNKTSKNLLQLARGKMEENKKHRRREDVVGGLVLVHHAILAVFRRVCLWSLE
jgi:hypothetical protein